jgi:hypothetical protein
MGQPVPISLGIRSNPARNRQAGYATLRNCFAEETDQDGKTTIVIYATEGLTAFGDPLDGGAVRAGINVDQTAYVVAGRNVYAVNASGVASLIGGIATDGPVYMERNRRIPAQIAIVSDGLYYVIDTGSNSITEINDPNLPAPISVSILDGIGILPVVNGGINLTEIDDFTSIDALAVGNAEAYPDDIVRSVTLEREAVFLGQTSIEWFQNTGDDPFPLTRVHALELGCLAGDSVTKVDTQSRKTVIWVAPDHTVRAMNGYGGDVISTNEIEELIKLLDQSGNAGELKGMAWAYAGRFFYALSCSLWTRVFDSKTGHWHNRESYGIGRWRVGTVFKFGNKIIAGDFETGQLYTLDNRVFTENGNYLVSEIITPPVHAFPYRIKVRRLDIDAATGVGLNTGDVHGDDPKLMISWSKDGGYSWSGERERQLHGDARYKRVKPVYRMGRAGHKGIIFRFRMSAPVERVLMQAALDFTRLNP